MNRPLEVVVLDDVSRFAGHVWQYLARGIGFGIGRMSDDGKSGGAGEEGLLVLQENAPLPIPSGEARIRWINAGAETWSDELDKAVQDIGDSPCCFLIDVRGPIRADQANYGWAKAVRLVRKGPQPSAKILLVSSYRTGSRRKDLIIQPKTWRTLEKVAQQMSVRHGSLAGLHILVTGAGFERAEDLGGAHGLGMPATKEILGKGWGRCGYSFDEDPKYEFPIPRKLSEDRSDEELKDLREAAKEPKLNLDVYWNEALKLVLECARRESKEPEVRDQKIAASLEEYKVREAFRQAFLNYDWGYLNQALDAAALEWTAWLSTNYTGFADRALVLTKRYSASAEPEPWSIVSTSNEAIQLIRNILHGDKQERVLFKLHGHIEHLLTMAVAGQDKELYSTLSLPIDSLHEVYTAAELFLKRRLEIPEGEVVWHVVGHRLSDALLVDLLKRVCRSRRHNHKFLFVGPDVTEDVTKERRDLLKSLNLPSRNFVGVPLSADEYLSRLRRFGLSADNGNLSAWRDDLLNPPHR